MKRAMATLLPNVDPDLFGKAHRQLALSLGRKLTVGDDPISLSANHNQNSNSMMPFFR